LGEEKRSRAAGAGPICLVAGMKKASVEVREIAESSMAAARPCTLALIPHLPEKTVVDTLFGTHSVPFRGPQRENVKLRRIRPSQPVVDSKPLGSGNRYQSTVSSPVVYYLDMLLAALQTGSGAREGCSLRILS
jgi:hypothetical protein